MQLNLLNELVEDFKVFKKTEEENQWFFYPQIQENFNKHWDLSHQDLASMYNLSLHSMHTRRFWNREAFEPKRVMLEFIKFEPEYVKHAFRDLFDESRNLNSRIERFIFYCDEILDLYKMAFPKSSIKAHYHDKNYEMPLLYLSLKYPDEYIPYDFECLIGFLQKVGSRQIPQTHDLERYYKVTKTIFSKIKEEIESPLFLVYEFFQFAAGRKYPLN
jgi:hypothetical protein